MSEMVDGWIREEMDIQPGAIWYTTVFAKGGDVRVIRIDRILTDRWGDDWRRREERRLLHDTKAKPTQFSGQGAPE